LLGVGAVTVGREDDAVDDGGGAAADLSFGNGSPDNALVGCCCSTRPHGRVSCFVLFIGRSLVLAVSVVVGSCAAPAPLDAEPLPTSPASGADDVAAAAALTRLYMRSSLGRSCFMSSGIFESFKHR